MGLTLETPTHMASVAGRKKSMVSSMDTPVAHNTLLNKAANQSTSLYQQCSALRARLLRIPAFSRYFLLAASTDTRHSTDPVTQLWDLFSIGISLCFLFDLLPPVPAFPKINHSDYNPDTYDANPDREKKHAIALFAMQVRSTQVTHLIPECEPFTVRDIWDRESTDGLVKVFFFFFFFFFFPSVLTSTLRSSTPSLPS